tara:strand:+ start:70 stop:1548 length:1479 start_codon:yes stop_codon:yes gene_type:complete
MQGILQVAPDDRFTNRVTRNMEPVRMAAGGEPPRTSSGIATSDAVLQNLPEAVNVDPKGQTRLTTNRSLISGTPQSSVKRVAGKGNLFEVSMTLPNGKTRIFKVDLPKGVPVYETGVNPDDFFKDINKYFDGVNFDEDVKIVDAGKTKTMNKAALIKTAFYKDAFGKLERDALAGVVDGYPRDYFYETKRNLKTNQATKVLKKDRFTDFLIKQYDYVPKNQQAAFADALDSTFKANYPGLVGKLGGIQPGTKSIKFQYAKAILDGLVKKFGEKSKEVLDYRNKLTDFIKNKNFMQAVEPFTKMLKPATPFASAVAKRATPLGYALDFPLVLAAGKAAQEMLEPVLEDKVIKPSGEALVQGENMITNFFKNKMPGFQDGGAVNTSKIEISDEVIAQAEIALKNAMREKGSNLTETEKLSLAFQLSNPKEKVSDPSKSDDFNIGMFEAKVNKMVDVLTMVEGSAIVDLNKKDRISDDVIDFIKRGMNKFNRMLD